ncbi:MAG: hypothetical protein WKG06_14770 [Segetibacter sp.]
MQEYLNQAAHNENFHQTLCGLTSNDDYPDWKVTCLFYVAFHYLKALADHRNKSIGNYHTEINKNIRSGTHMPTMPISKTAYQNYMSLFHYSQTARYDGYTDITVFNAINRGNYSHALQCLNDFKKFIQSSGVPVLVIT